ncbi:MAG: PqqD family protein [Acidimicrobiales bacterium]
MTTPRYRRPPDALWHRTSGRILVSPSDEAGVLELRDIPALVWEALDGELSLDQLVEDLAAVFDQSDEAIRADVGELVAAMVEAGLVDAV